MINVFGVLVCVNQGDGVMDIVILFHVVTILVKMYPHLIAHVLLVYVLLCI